MAFGEACLEDLSGPALRTIETAGYLGGSLTLDDGSFWTVKSCDRALVRAWRDASFLAVVFLPNEGWILSTDYPFFLYNVDADQQIEVKLEQPSEGDKCSYITVIDESHSLVELADSAGSITIWHVSWWDRNLLRGWEKDDVIMVGCNGRWNRGANPYILYNHKTKDYVRGQLYLKGDQ